MPAVPPAQISDGEFARALVDVLADGTRSEERQKRLLGVVRRQLLHAAERFGKGADARAMQSVLGALYLMRSGEHSSVVIDAETRVAIDGAIERLSARGDVGRAKVLYALRATSASPEEKKEIEEHVRALDRFRADTLTGKKLERAGDAERNAMGMAMLVPDHIDEAIRATDDWIGLGIQGNLAYQQTGKRPASEEAIEIARSLGSGPATIVALMLRYADVNGAIEKVLATNARRMMDPHFFARLKDVEDHDDAKSWRKLFDAFEVEVDGRIGGEIGIDADLYSAARFIILIETYRRDPTHHSTSIELARALIEFGMSEAVPLIVDGAIDDEADVADVVQGIRAVARAIIADSSVGDIGAASRTIAASGRFLDRAKTLLGHKGGAMAIAELRYSMASILLEGGKVEQAEQLLTTAISEFPKANGYLLRARVYRQTNAADRALSDVATVVSMKGADLVELADARVLEYEIRLSRGEVEGAKSALAAALSSAKTAATGKSGAPKARALAALGRVLQAYGDRDGARGAFARAMESVPNDRDLAGEMMLEAASAGLTLGDREGLRTALRKGVDAGVPRDDLVYGALWLVLAERQAGTTPDAVALDILDGASRHSNWVGRLGAWARGKLTDEELTTSASNEASKIEAAFYVAMAKRARGTTVDDALRKVASSPLVHSAEVKIARDLIAPRPSFDAPKDAKGP